MARKTKATAEPLGNTEIRRIVLQYFYDRNANATSLRGKKGSAATIKTIRAELKEQHGLSVQQVMANLNYLMSQGWVEQKEIKKDVPLRTGTVVPSLTTFYSITAAGIDRIEGPDEFSRDPFHGIRIEATGQNIITIGDGNQINAAFKEVGEALSELAEAVRSSPDLDEAEKLADIADIETMQAQLAKPQPNRSVLRSVWAGLVKLATIESVASAASRVATLLVPLIGGGA